VAYAADRSGDLKPSTPIGATTPRLIVSRFATSASNPSSRSVGQSTVVGSANSDGLFTTVGVDLAKDIFAVCVLDATGAVLQRRSSSIARTGSGSLASSIRYGKALKSYSIESYLEPCCALAASRKQSSYA
jgi:hypothetical protein